MEERGDENQRAYCYGCHYHHHHRVVILTSIYFIHLILSHFPNFDLHIVSLPSDLPLLSISSIHSFFIFLSPLLSPTFFPSLPFPFLSFPSPFYNSLPKLLFYLPPPYPFLPSTPFLPPYSFLPHSPTLTPSLLFPFSLSHLTSLPTLSFFSLPLSLPPSLPFLHSFLRSSPPLYLPPFSIFFSPKGIKHLWKIDLYSV